MWGNANSVGKLYNKKFDSFTVVTSCISEVLMQEPDYAKLMALRSSALRTNGVKLQQIAPWADLI